MSTVAIPSEVLLYSAPTDDPDVRINFSRNLFLPGINVYTFIKNMAEVLSYLYPSIKLEPSYPEWVINYTTEKEFTAAVTWEITSMQPAQLGGSPGPSSRTGVKEIKPRLRKEVTSGDSTYQVTGQIFDAFFAFVIWAQTASEAEALTQWFQSSFMANYSALFGSELVYLYSRTHDKELLKVNNLLQTRTLTYYVRLAENSAVKTKKIQEIKLKLDSQV